MEEEQDNGSGILGLLSLTGGCGCAAGLAVVMAIVGALLTWIVLMPAIAG